MKLKWKFKIVSESDDLSQKSQPTKSEKYELATHTVKIRRTGALSDVQAIWDLPGMYN